MPPLRSWLRVNARDGARNRRPLEILPPLPRTKKLLARLLRSIWTRIRLLRRRLKRTRRTLLLPSRTVLSPSGLSTEKSKQLQVKCPVPTLLILSTFVKNHEQ